MSVTSLTHITLYFSPYKSKNKCLCPFFLKYFSSMCSVSESITNQMDGTWIHQLQTLHHSQWCLDVRWGTLSSACRCRLSIWLFWWLNTNIKLEFTQSMIFTETRSEDLNSKSRGCDFQWIALSWNLFWIFCSLHIC